MGTVEEGGGIVRGLVSISEPANQITRQSARIAL